MRRRMLVSLVPGSRGRATLDAELPALSRAELEAILELVGGQGTCPQAPGLGTDADFCPDGECVCKDDGCDPPPSGQYN